MTKKATREGAGSVTPRKGGDTPAEPGKLNPKQQRFVEEYLVDLNAKQAAIRAGYSAKSAEVNGPRLLGNAQVAAAVEAKRRELTVATGITVERVIKELGRIAFSDLRGLYREDGSLKLPSEWDDDTAAVVAGLDIDELWEGHGDERQQIGLTKKVKLWEKTKSLEALLKHLGAAGDKAATINVSVLNVPGLDAARAKLAEVLAR